MNLSGMASEVREENQMCSTGARCRVDLESQAEWFRFELLWVLGEVVFKDNSQDHTG